MSAEYPLNKSEFTQDTELVEKPRLGLEKLPELMKYMESIGLTSALYSIDQAYEYLRDIKTGLPLVNEGSNGIRVSYDKRRDELRVWFTNGFEDPNNPQRLEIENWLKENFAESTDDFF